MFSLLLVSLGVLSATEMEDTDAVRYRQLIESEAPAWLAEYHVPGATIAYIENGKVSWSLAFGHRAEEHPATTDTLWNVASLTKPVTAEVIHRLADLEMIDLDQPMSEAYVDPDLLEDARHRQLTPRIALVHKTGFPNWRSQTGGTLSFIRDPGKKTEYSGEGYSYLGRFAEAVTGKAFPRLGLEYVFSPVGMLDTSYLPPHDKKQRWAHPHDESGQPLTLAPHEDWSGADNLITTVGDYAAFVIHVMESADPTEDASNRFVITDNQISDGCPLPKSLCPVAVGFSEAAWEIFEYADHRVIQHGGADSGERALAYFDQQSRNGAVILTNGANGGKLIARVVEILYPENRPYHALLRMQAGMDLGE